jgi:hypothetical protein
MHKTEVRICKELSFLIVLSENLIPDNADRK